MCGIGEGLNDPSIVRMSGELYRWRMAAMSRSEIESRCGVSG